MGVFLLVVLAIVISKGQYEKAHTYNLLKESIVEDTLNKFNAKEA